MKTTNRTSYVLVNNDEIVSTHSSRAAAERALEFEFWNFDCARNACVLTLNQYHEGRVILVHAFREEEITEKPHATRQRIIREHQAQGLEVRYERW